MKIQILKLCLSACFAAGLFAVAVAKDKEKPSRGEANRPQNSSSAKASSNNRGSDNNRPRIESSPRIERRNDNSSSSASNRSPAQPKAGNGSSNRDQPQRDMRNDNERNSNKRPDPVRRIEIGEANGGRSDKDRNNSNSTSDRRDKTPTLPPSIRQGVNPTLGNNNLNQPDKDRNRTDRRDDDKNRDRSNQPRFDVPRNEAPRPLVNSGANSNNSSVRGINNDQRDRSKILSDGRENHSHRVTPIRVEKNGLAHKLDSKTELPNLKPEVKDRVVALRQARDHKEFERNLKELRDLPDGRASAAVAGLKLDRMTGVYQQRVERHDFRHLHESDLGRRLSLDRQFQLHRQGDICRRMDLGPTLVRAGGWHHRYHGRVIPAFTRTSFSVWYAGGGCYPQYCWAPRWSAWVDWCWWDTCIPIYDPRPVFCRPIVYRPCPVWVVHEYPVWQPLPVVACGTWIDVPPVAVVSGADLQLLATRFVDNGHSEQNLGPRYRVWLRNNGPLPVTTPFNVTLVAANGLVPQSDLPQAGAIINAIDAGEVQSVDIRLPLAANRLAIAPEGQRIPFGYLHVLVDSHRDLTEPNEADNGTVIARNDILPVDPAVFSSDVSAGAPGNLISIAGEGLGPEPGQAIVSINGLQLEAEIHGWYDLGVRLALPNIALAGPVDADILIIRGDGAAANPLDFEMTPQSMLGEQPLPPIPSP